MSIEYKKILSKGLKSSLDGTSIKNGNIRFTTDTAQLFLDYNNTRIEITDFVKGLTEEEIKSIVAPLPKLYLSSDTNKLFVYNNNQWCVISDSTRIEAVQSNLENEIDSLKIYTDNEIESVRSIIDSKEMSLDSKITNAKSEANTYTDNKIDQIVGEGASTTLDTIGEISKAIEEHRDVTDALNAAIGTKANDSDLTDHINDTVKHITSTERTNWNDANSKKHTHSNKSVLDATTASYTTDLNTKLNGIATGANNYTLPTAGSTLGGVKTTSTVTSASGYTACPIIGGVPYYKDTNTTYSNFVKSGSSAASGLVPAPSTTAGTTKYLREDGTWQVPPNTNTTYTLSTITGILSVDKGGTGTTSLTSGAALIGNGTGAVSTRSITNMTTLGHINYNTNLMTTNTLAYWNGAYASNGGSNLAYCCKGAFGDIVTYNAASFASASHGHSGYAAANHTHSYMPLNPTSIELYYSTPFIDFHYGSSAVDFTSRIIESSSGVLNANGVYFDTDDTSGLMTGSGYIYSYDISVHDVYTDSIMCNTNTSTILFRSNPAPDSSGDYTLGTSSRKWGQIYSTKSSISTSDRNQKENITSLNDTKYEEFFKLLKPVSYKFKNNGEIVHDRIHTGFIAQDVEEAMNEVGLTDLEFAGLCKDYIDIEIVKKGDKNGKKAKSEEIPLDEPYWSYSLRYEEFISLNTQMVQKLFKINEEKDSIIQKQQEEIDLLKEQVAEILNKLSES